MKFSLKDAKPFSVEEIKGFEYNTKQDFANASVVFAKVKGRHGKIKNVKSDRVYIVVDGEGKFVIDGKETEVKKNDVVIVPKNSPYDYQGNMKIFPVDCPAFEKDADMKLE